jgi:hypothetical protein
MSRAHYSTLLYSFLTLNVTNLPSEPDSANQGQDYGPRPSPDHIDVVDCPRVVHNKQTTLSIFGEATGPTLSSFGSEHATSYPEYTFPPPPHPPLLPLPPPPPAPFRPESFGSTIPAKGNYSDSWINHN